MKKNFALRVSPELMERIEKCKGNMSINRYIETVLMEKQIEVMLRALEDRAADLWEDSAEQEQNTKAIEFIKEFAGAKLWQINDAERQAAFIFIYQKYNETIANE